HDIKVARGLMFFPKGPSCRLFDATTWQPLGPWWPAPSASALALSPDGKIVLTSTGNQGQFRDAATGAPLGPPLGHQGDVVAAAFSADSRILVTGSQDQTARLWNVADGRLLGSPLRHQANVTAVTFSPDGRIVLTGTNDETARFWDVATTKPIGPGFRREPWPAPASDSEQGLCCLAFHPEGREILTGSRAGDLQRWETPPAPLEDSVERLVLWTKTISDRELDAGGVAGWQTAESWNQHQRRLQEFG